MLNESPEKKTVLTFSDRLKVYEMLKGVCIKVDDKHAVYKSGWNDIRVAEAIGGKFTRHHVRYIRTEMLGPTHFRGPYAKKDTTSTASPELEARITQIEEYLTRKNPGWNA